MKTCIKCKEQKPRHEFYTRTNGMPMGECKKCYVSRTNKRARQIKYGLSDEQIRFKLAGQDGKCAICKIPITLETTDKNTKVHVDHDHETGAIRGLLCSPCNLALGYFKDSISSLLSAAQYLEEYREATYVSRVCDQ